MLYIWIESCILCRFRYSHFHLVACCCIIWVFLKVPGHFRYCLFKHANLTLTWRCYMSTSNEVKDKTKMKLWGAETPYYITSPFEIVTCVAFKVILLIYRIHPRLHQPHHLPLTPPHLPPFIPPSSPSPCWLVPSVAPAWIAARPRSSCHCCAVCAGRPPAWWGAARPEIRPGSPPCTPPGLRTGWAGAECGSRRAPGTEGEEIGRGGRKEARGGFIHHLVMCCVTAESTVSRAIAFAHDL